MRPLLQRYVNAILALVYPECCQICHKSKAAPEEGFVCAGCRSEASFIEPPFCHRCGLPFSGQIHQRFECANCEGLTWYFETARSAVRAKGLVLDIIHRYKYKHQLWFEPFLAQMFISGACPVADPQRQADNVAREGADRLEGDDTTLSNQQAGPQQFDSGVLLAADWDFLVPVPLHPVKQREREFNQAERLARRLSLASRIPLNQKVLKRIQPTRTQTRLSREERAENVRGAFALVDGVDLKGQRLVLIDDVMTTGATTNACARALRQGGAAKVCVWTLARGT